MDSWEVIAGPGKPGSRRSDSGRTVDSVENRSPIICFAITSDGKRAAYWRLRAGLKQPELFLEREGYGKKFHSACTPRASGT